MELYASELTKEEREIIQQNLKSSDGFRVRQAQMILMSADEHLKVDERGRWPGCQGQGVKSRFDTICENRTLKPELPPF